MAVNPSDMNELKRMSTNLYDAEKACINRIIHGINVLNNELCKIRLENDKLRDDLATCCKKPN